MVESMEVRATTKTRIGMQVGLILGIGVAVSLFKMTEDPVWLSFAGVGIALGLGIGAYMDKQET